MNKKIVATIEARMTSSRLPGKVLIDLAGKPALEQMIARVNMSAFIDDVVIATTVNSQDDAIVEWAEKNKISYFRGSEDDVLLRVLEAARAFNADILVELTGDCPLIDPTVMDQTIRHYLDNDFDYVSNILKRTYPRGLDTQVFSTNVLAKVNELTQDPIDHEHVSIYIYEHPETFSLSGIEAEGKIKRPDLRFTLDTPQDLEMIQKIYSGLFEKNTEFSTEDVIDYLEANPDVAALNHEIHQKPVR